jgi:hypothetical protein
MRILPFAALPLFLFPAAVLADGNVTTRLDRKNRLEIKGDGGNNEFDVRHGTNAMGQDVLIVEGKNGTTIDGQPKTEIPLPDGGGRVPEVNVLPGPGNDVVNVDLSTLPQDKRFDALGVDEEEFFDDDDNLTVKNVRLVPGGKLKVKSGKGDDTATVESCDAEQLNVVDIEGANNNVTIRDCNVAKKLRVDVAGAGGTVRVSDCFYGDAQIDAVSKDVAPSLDTRIQRTNGKKISYQGSGGDDEIAFEDNVIESVSAKLGGGNDLISFTGSTIDKVSIDGGPGPLDCFDDTENGNVFGSFKEKGFEPCDGPVMLEYFGLGADPIDEPPADAVAWRTNNPEIGHLDGPFALPGADNPLGLPVLDPLAGVAPAHWADPDLCDWIHLHDAFEGHGDPAPGPPDTESACGHGALEWARLVPAN